MNQMEYPLHIFNPKENIKLKRCSTLEIHRLQVALRHIIRIYSVRISKLCMGASLYGIFVFLREFTAHMLIFHSHSALSKYENRLQVFFFIIII